MNYRKFVAPDSKLRQFVKVLQFSEIPYSFLLGVGMSLIGAALKRNVYFDQGEVGKIYPNLSAMLIGPSGCGKDVAIRKAEEIIQKTGIVKIIEGRTIEYLGDELSKLTPPSAALIPAKELADFLGKKEYQSGIIEGLTNLMSTGYEVSMRTKTNPNCRIIEPTITVMTGTTKDWLQGNLPEGALGGGFLPRFLLIPEEDARQKVPLVNDAMSKEDKKEVAYAKAQFISWITAQSKFWAKQKYRYSMPMDNDAKDIYKNWYHGRMERFPASVRSYANRARDSVLRMMMLHAISRNRNFIDSLDAQFGIIFMEQVGHKVADVAVPPSLHGKCMQELLSAMPATRSRLIATYGMKYSLRILDESLKTLREGQLAKQDPDTKEWERCDVHV